MHHVLIVESDAWLSESYDAIISAQNTTEKANSCEEALARIDEKLPDVILLDEALRGAGGVELIHELRSYPDLADIPIVLCSQLDSEQLAPFRASFEAYGIKEVLTKVNLKPIDLLRAIKYAASKN